MIASDSDQELAELGCVQRYLELYEVPKKVLIHAPPLQVPRIVATLLVTLVVVVWLITGLRFYELNDISISNSFLQLAPPYGMLACDGFDFNCDDIPSKSNNIPSYCMEAALNRTQTVLHHNFFSWTNGYNKDRWPFGRPVVTAVCKRFDANDVLEEEGHPLIMTARTVVPQSRCNGIAGLDCIWRNVGFSVEFVEDVETFWLVLRHEVMAEGVHLRNPTSAGYVVVNGQTFRLHCTHSACKQAGIHQNSGDVPSCKSLAGGKACFSSTYADYLSLDLVLQAANVTLDSLLRMPGDSHRQSEPQISRRYLGASIAIDIRYTNTDPLSLWQWPNPGLKGSYIYTFRAMGDYAHEVDVVHELEGETRKLIRKSGIKVFISFRGKLASWNPAYAIQKLAILNVILGLTLWGVDKVLMWFYRWVPWFQHLPYMKSYYADVQTPHHEEVLKQEEKEDFMMEHAKKHRSRQLREMQKARKTMSGSASEDEDLPLCCSHRQPGD